MNTIFDQKNPTDNSGCELKECGVLISMLCFILISSVGVLYRCTSCLYVLFVLSHTFRTIRFTFMCTCVCMCVGGEGKNCETACLIIIAS